MIQHTELESIRWTINGSLEEKSEGWVELPSDTAKRSVKEIVEIIDTLGFDYYNISDTKRIKVKRRFRKDGDYLVYHIDHLSRGNLLEEFKQLLTVISGIYTDEAIFESYYITDIMQYMFKIDVYLLRDLFYFLYVKDRAIFTIMEELEYDSKDIKSMIKCLDDTLYDLFSRHQVSYSVHHEYGIKSHNYYDMILIEYEMGKGKYKIEIEI